MIHIVAVESELLTLIPRQGNGEPSLSVRCLLSRRACVGDAGLGLGLFRGRQGLASLSLGDSCPVSVGWGD